VLGLLSGKSLEDKRKVTIMENLQEILRLHQLWLSNDSEGVFADLEGADLRRADLRLANLEGAYLEGADLYEVDLRETKLPTFQITPVGYPMVGFKKLRNGTVCVVEVPAEAKRTASLVGRKCRAEYVWVLEGGGASRYSCDTQYEVGSIVYPDKYDGDIRIECTNGIHFFQTREEAENY